MSETRKLLSVDGVGVQFGGIRAVADVSFDIEEGELTALIGPNGAGKTTLLTSITHPKIAQTGKIFFDGEELTGMDAYRVTRKGLARTFQAGEIVQTLSVQENVMAGAVVNTGLGWVGALIGISRSRLLLGELREQAHSLLTLVGLEPYADQPAGALAAGQQRLLAIARAMAGEPRLLLLDEPGAGLNEMEKQQLAEIIMRISGRGKTILFIEHDMALVSTVAKRILVLDQGRLIADGTPEAVRRDEKVVSAYLGSRKNLDDASQKPAMQIVQRDLKPFLVIRHLGVAYGGSVALQDVSIEVKCGEIVALVGANGAGKSTLLKSIARIVTPNSGDIDFLGASLDKALPDDAVKRGISLVPEGRELFPSMSVHDNLMIGRYPVIARMGRVAILGRSGKDVGLQARLDFVHSLFPVLRERAGQMAGTLSGGQAQMLAIGRALMAEPELLMLDEPSLGIAPQVIESIMETLLQLKMRGVTILLVEQNAAAALEIADRGYVLASGQVVTSGDARTLLNDEGILRAYLGGNKVNPDDRRASIRLVS